MISFLIIAVSVICIFFFLNFFLTQRIYSENKFKSIVLSIGVPIVGFLLARNENKTDAMNFSLVLFHYTWQLWLVKKTYKKINADLIKRKLVSAKFTGKDFTYVLWESDIIASEDSWDKIRAPAPSWLDRSITFALVLLPILFTLPITYITQNSR